MLANQNRRRSHNHVFPHLAAIHDYYGIPLKNLNHAECKTPYGRCDHQTMSKDLNGHVVVTVGMPRSVVGGAALRRGARRGPPAQPAASVNPLLRLVPRLRVRSARTRRTAHQHLCTKPIEN